MRPTRITVEGFSAYRSRVEVDLDGVEFFALAGPTGAGKSSLVDAMIFALYGRVPRLGARAVAPVITAGADRARVALEFEVDGEGYIASRVAERTDTGATVREARLERADGTSLASGAGEVTSAIEGLLRLRFDDFTKTVVLPQGEFARFLNAGSKERRDLLRDLLGLDIYTRMRELANLRKSVAGERLASARAQLEALDVPDDGAFEAGQSRVALLEALAKELDASMADLDVARGRLDAARAELEKIDDAMERLGEVRAPDHLDEMEQRHLVARDNVAEAQQALEDGQKEIDRLEEALAELPTKEAIESARETHRALGEVDERIGELDLKSVEDGVTVHERALAKAQQAFTRADRDLTRMRLTHAAHTVAVALRVGENCPVCDQEVRALPELDSPEGLELVEETYEAAAEGLATARDDAGSARARLTELSGRHTELADHRQRLMTALEDVPSLRELDRAFEERSTLSDEMAEALSQRGRLEDAFRRAQKSLEEAAEAIRTVGRALMVAREEIADLRPPHSESDDPAVQWKDLIGWRDARVEELTGDREGAVTRVSDLEAHVAELNQRLVADLEAALVPVEHPFAVSVARETEMARQRVERMRESLERAAELERQVDEATEAEMVANALANHLRANGFERWLMAGAITGLVSGANELLSQLSGGGFSLEADEEGSFRIIDHRNADELRDVATLSGGETFLVSLALSLSLAETLSGSGGAGLDAIILDEGFGSLDEESLDVVAAVLEELAGSGLMVGVITHVKELAARAPVRYQVTREPEGSKVEVLT